MNFQASDVLIQRFIERGKRGYFAHCDQITKKSFDEKFFETTYFIKFQEFA